MTTARGSEEPGQRVKLSRIHRSSSAVLRYTVDIEYHGTVQFHDCFLCCLFIFCKFPLRHLSPGSASPN